MNTIAPSQNALADNEQVIQLAEDFVDRYRRGEHPSLTEYQQRYPQLASEVESLIDALLVMEKLGSKRTKSPLQLRRSHPRTTRRVPVASCDWSGWHGRGVRSSAILAQSTGRCQGAAQPGGGTSQDEGPVPAGSTYCCRPA